MTLVVRGRRGSASSLDSHLEKIGMRLDGHCLPGDPSPPTKPLLFPPPRGEVSDEDEKIWRRELQRREDLAREADD